VVFICLTIDYFPGLATARLAGRLSVAPDVGCGPGSVTASLGRAAVPDGLALGVDISESMPARAVRAEARPQIGFLRADAQQLPLRDETVDAVVSIAVLQLVADPAAVLAEMARVLRPHARLAVIVGCGGHARPSPAETDITHRGRYQMRRSKT
jgi:SAM-dependent methyltransferase